MEAPTSIPISAQARELTSIAAAVESHARTLPRDVSNGSVSCDADEIERYGTHEGTAGSAMVRHKVVLMASYSYGLSICVEELAWVPLSHLPSAKVVSNGQSI